MTKAEVKKLVPGIYLVFWDSGSSSVAAVGTTLEGDKWIAPIEWVFATRDQNTWDEVVAMKMLSISKCPDCEGDGYSRGPRLGDEPCHSCNGNGTLVGEWVGVEKSNLS